MPSVEGMRQHLVEAHSAEIVKRAGITEPVDLSFLRKGFIDVLTAKDLRMLHLHLHRDALRALDS